MDSEAAQLYVSLMHEIKRRHHSAQVAASEPSRLLYEPVVVDHAYLQIRKILELISFSILSANRSIFDRLGKGVTREYHAEKILYAIERKFGDVYPKPVIQEKSSDPKIKTDLVDRKSGHLTRSEFRALYAQCGDILHGRNPLRKPLDTGEQFRGIQLQLDKIRLLLDCHIARIVDDPNLYLIQMGSGIESSPVYNVFSPVPKSKA